ncbi:MAG: hypothetical protein JRJ29_03415 [Deltaproteobacteria bacterium]|nr:hypothetical protein [Deltaproteobacteria bacterium]
MGSNTGEDFCQPKKKRGLTIKVLLGNYWRGESEQWEVQNSRFKETACGRIQSSRFKVQHLVDLVAWVFHAACDL